MNLKEKLLIVGSRSTAIEILEITALQYNVVFVIGDDEEMDSKYEKIKDSDLKKYVLHNKCKYIISIGELKLRLKFTKIFKELNVEAVNVIHPLSCISPSSSIGKGNYIAAFAVLSANSNIGNNCMVNYNVTIGHDVTLKDNVVVNPGSRISGFVQIGENVLVGANSFVFEDLIIGDDCLIDAMTYVERDLKKNTICSSKQTKYFKRVQ
jgi:sugar O-acyltransferase (sialic acid O-acetyltransferase NeuD family)